MLKFFKDLFGKKDGGAIKWFRAPAGTEVHDRNVGALLVSAAEGNCNGVALQGAKLSEKGVAKLAGINGLKALSLTDSEVDDSAMSALKGASELTELSLKGLPISGACFVKIGKLPNLTTLDLSKTQVVDMTLVALKQNCPNLKSLDLSGSKITDQAIEYIGAFKGLEKIKLNDLVLDGARLAMLTHDSSLVIEGQ
jgi:Leucine-rich repeat (LRR) protein